MHKYCIFNKINRAKKKSMTKWQNDCQYTQTPMSRKCFLDFVIDHVDAQNKNMKPQAVNDGFKAWVTFDWKIFQVHFLLS